MNAPLVYLYSCTTCGASGPEAKAKGEPTTYACDVPQSAPFHCPRCRAGLIPAEEHAQVNEAVTLVDANPLAEWVVLARDGDQVTIRPLGLPSFPSRTASLAEIRPKFSYTRLERARSRRKA